MKVGKNINEILKKNILKKKCHAFYLPLDVRFLRLKRLCGEACKILLFDRAWRVFEKRLDDDILAFALEDKMGDMQDESVRAYWEREGWNTR